MSGAHALNRRTRSSRWRTRRHWAPSRAGRRSFGCVGRYGNRGALSGAKSGVSKTMAKSEGGARAGVQGAQGLVPVGGVARKENNDRPPRTPRAKIVQQAGIGAAPSASMTPVRRGCPEWRSPTPAGRSGTPGHCRRGACGCSGCRRGGRSTRRCVWRPRRWRRARARRSRTPTGRRRGSGRPAEARQLELAHHQFVEGGRWSASDMAQVVTAPVLAQPGELAAPAPSRATGSRGGSGWAPRVVVRGC